MEEWRQQELYKAMQVLPVEGLKIICWINGGAAIGILTYLGNIASKAPAPPIPGIKPAIIWYCSGLSAAALTFLISYIVQMISWENLQAKKSVPLFLLRQRLLVLVGCLLSLFGVVAFFMGSLRAAEVLVH